MKKIQKIHYKIWHGMWRHNSFDSEGKAAQGCFFKHVLNYVMG